MLFQIPTVVNCILFLTFIRLSGTADFHLRSKEPEEMCQDLDQQEIQSFMHNIHDRSDCYSPCSGLFKKETNESTYRHMYEGILVQGNCSNSDGEYAFASSVNLRARTPKAITIFEFTVNQSANHALRKIHKYISAYHYLDNKVILSVGVNYRWTNDTQYYRDALLLGWTAELRAPNETILKSYPPTAVKFFCHYTIDTEGNKIYMKTV